MSSWKHSGTSWVDRSPPRGWSASLHCWLSVRSSVSFVPSSTVVAHGTPSGGSPGQNEPKSWCGRATGANSTHGCSGAAARLRDCRPTTSTRIAGWRDRRRERTGLVPAAQQAEVRPRAVELGALTSGEAPGELLPAGHTHSCDQASSSSGSGRRGLRGSAGQRRPLKDLLAVPHYVSLAR